MLFVKIWSLKFPQLIYLAGPKTNYMSSHEHFEGDTKKFTLTALLSFAAVFCILMLFMRCHGDYKPVDGNHHAEAKETSANHEGHEIKATEVAEPTHESIKVKLINGKELDAFKGGIEDKLVSFLNDAHSQAGKDVWFDFDNLNFETGKATLTKESNAQVANIAAILAAYPKLKIKIGGYTDKSGDAALNKKLSQERADAVVAALTSLKANAAQLTGAEGYGSEFAKAAANAPDEERKKDRHISIGVREK